MVMKCRYRLVRHYKGQTVPWDILYRVLFSCYNTKYALQLIYILVFMKHFKHQGGYTDGARNADIVMTSVARMHLLQDARYGEARDKSD